MDEANIDLDALQAGGEWYIFEAIGEFESFGPRFRWNRVSVGTKGYVKRNEFDPKYYQVLARATHGSIVGFYLSIKDARYKLWVTRPAPDSPEIYWHNYFGYMKDV